MDTSGVDETFCEEILSKVKEVLNLSICQDLTSIWRELWDEPERANRRRILADECQKELSGFLKDILANEKISRDQYISRVEELLNEISELQKVLETTIPYEDVENLPLHVMAHCLNKKAEKYRVIKNQRIQKLKMLINKEAELCQKLGMVSQVTNPTEIPNEAKLQLLENHIAAMEQEKMNRTVTFLEHRQAIIKAFEELGTKPLLKFEKEVVSEEAAEKFKLINENMIKLAELRQKLEKQMEEAREDVKELSEKLKVLWSQLGEEENEEFLSNNAGCSADAMKALKDELERCLAKKRENIGVIIGRLREMLVEEWDRCLIGAEEREKFRPFNINWFSEDLCDLHELEIKRLNNFYRDNEQIFVKIAKHQKLFNKLLELENESKNANRYYNRGGQLLREEKERKLITKDLPVVEEELRALLKKYEEEHQQPFTCFGVPVAVNLDEQWNANFDQKTIEKLLRKKSERTPLGKRGCTTPFTPLSGNKVPKLNEETPASSATENVTQKTSSRSVTVRRKKRTDRCQVQDALVDLSYNDFQSALQSKIERSAKSKEPAPRSTAVNDGASTSGILRERNTPSKLRPLTPSKALLPLCSPSALKCPWTLPRPRHQSKSPRLTPAHSHLPLII